MIKVGKINSSKASSIKVLAAILLIVNKKIKGIIKLLKILILITNIAWTIRAIVLNNLNKINQKVYITIAKIEMIAELNRN